MEQPAPDCREVLKRLYLYLDGEIAGEDCSAIERHFADCRECLEHADFEKAVKEVVRRKCQEKQVPAGLLDALRARFRA